MTDLEQSVIEAAVDLAMWQSALDCGCPALNQKAGAYKDLMNAVSKLHSEHDGKWEPHD